MTKRKSKKSVSAQSAFGKSDFGFWESIFDSPDSIEPLLVYSDWLEENGHNNRALLLRAQARMNCPIESPEFVLSGVRRRKLIKQLRGELLGSVRTMTSRVEFFGGIVIPEMTASKFNFNRKTIFKDAPVAGIRFNDMKGVDFAKCKELSRFRVLDLRGEARQSDRGLLLQSKHLNSLRALNAGKAANRKEFASAFLDGKWKDLTRVCLANSDSVNVEELLRSRSAKKVEHLEFRYLGHQGMSVVEALSDPSTLPNVKSLVWPRMRFGASKMEFERRLNLPSLRVLDASSEFFSGRQFHDLLANKNFKRLESLALLSSTQTLKPEHIPKSSPPKLTRLYLRQIGFSQSGAIALAESPLFNRLESLRIAPGNLAGHLDKVAQAKRVSKCKLKYLELANRSPTAAQLAAIAKTNLFSNIETLILCCSGATVNGLAKNSLPKLLRLELGNCKLGKTNIERLVRAPWFSKLETLDLAGAKISNGALKPFESLRSNLKVLMLGRIEDEDVESLTKCQLENIEYVSFDLSRISKGVVAKLRKHLRQFETETGVPFIDERWYDPPGQLSHGVAAKFFRSHPVSGIVLPASKS